MSFPVNALYPNRDGFFRRAFVGSDESGIRDQDRDQDLTIGAIDQGIIKRESTNRCVTIYAAISGRVFFEQGLGGFFLSIAYFDPLRLAIKTKCAVRQKMLQVAEGRHPHAIAHKFPG